MREISGNLITMAENKELDVMIHGCNCFCNMGNGIAKQIKETFPEAYWADCTTGKGDRTKLGFYSKAYTRNDVIIVNGYTQYNYGPGLQLDYAALAALFYRIKQDFSGLKIRYPLIGAGLAGGDWSLIKDIIDRELDGEDHAVIILK